MGSLVEPAVLIFGWVFNPAYGCCQAPGGGQNTKYTKKTKGTKDFVDAVLKVKREPAKKQDNLGQKDGQFSKHHKQDVIVFALLLQLPP